MNWYCSEILFLVLNLSRFQQGQIMLKIGKKKKKCCTILVRPGLQLGAQTISKLTSNFPAGDEATGTSCFNRSHEKESHRVALQVGCILKLLGC